MKKICEIYVELPIETSIGGYDIDEFYELGVRSLRGVSNIFLSVKIKLFLLARKR